MRINVKQLPCDKVTFLQKKDQYFAAREAHKKTEGVPAPYPEFEILRTLYESGEALEIIDGPLPGDAVSADAEQRRLAAVQATQDARRAQVEKIEAAIAAMPPECQEVPRLMLELLKGSA